jgi:hypothetical protein
VAAGSWVLRGGHRRPNHPPIDYSLATLYLVSFIKTGRLSYPSAPLSPVIAYGINDNAAIVGQLLLSNNTSPGFLYDNGGFTILSAPNSVATRAYGINNLGEIVGDYEPTPPPLGTPLPSAFPLFATGLGALGLLGWRRKRRMQVGHNPGGGLVVIGDSFLVAHRKPIIFAAARNDIPAVYFHAVFARDGGLLSYGPDNADIFRRAASYVDRILRGANPAELPVQVPINFERVINLKTAKLLGLTVPLTLQVAADEVIE